MVHTLRAKRVYRLLQAYLILDQEFSGDLLELSRHHHVWICNSPKNTPQIDAVWDVEGEATETNGVSSFNLRNKPNEDIYKWIGIISTHHQGWDSISVFGLNLVEISEAEIELWVKRKLDFVDCGSHFKIQKTFQPVN